MKKLIVIPGSYPYSIAAEDTFLNPELKVLKKYFEIHIIPLSAEGILQNIDKDFIIHDSYAKSSMKLNKRLVVSYFFNIIFSRQIYMELFDFPSILFNVSKVKSLIAFFIRKEMFYNYLNKSENKDLLRDSILYTYWFDYATTAIGALKMNQNIKAITKAHRYDLYAFRRDNGYIPFRYQALETIDKVFLISNDGFEYLNKLYPNFKHKYYLAPMGTDNHGILNSFSSDNIFRIVSCSFISPVKRVDLIIESLMKLSQRTNKKIEWYHIGGGDMFETISEFALEKLSNKVCYKLLGNMTNEQIFRFYDSQCLDLFIMLSSSEGKPVALMEATSVSLPILATEVGGIPEIAIHGRNAILVPEDTTAENVSNEILNLINNPDKLIKMREESYKVWQESANAEVNFENFAQELLKLSEES